MREGVRMRKGKQEFQIIDDTIPAGMPWNRILAIIKNPPYEKEQELTYYTPKNILRYIRTNSRKETSK